MKKYRFLVATILLLSACSTPRYSYHFSHHDYNSGKKKIVSTEQEQPGTLVQPADDQLAASADENTIITPMTETTPVITKEEAVTKLKSLSKEERKELKKELRKFVKENKKNSSVKAGGKAERLEYDVKLAAIFGAVGLVLLIIGGDVLYVLGAIALLIGLYFFIRWLSRQ